MHNIMELRGGDPEGKGGGILGLYTQSNTINNERNECSVTA